MPSLSARTEWVMVLTNRELALVCRALRGEMRPEEKQEALDLCDVLTDQRAKGLAQAVKDSERIAHHLETAKASRTSGDQP